MARMRKVCQTWGTGLTEVGPGCYAYIQSGGLNVSNAGLVVGPDNCLVIDTLYVRPMTEAFQRAIPRPPDRQGLTYPQCAPRRALAKAMRPTVATTATIANVFDTLPIASASADRTAVPRITPA